MIRTKEISRTEYLGLAVIALYAISQAGCSHAASETRALTPVRTAQVETISTGSETRYSANITPNAQVDLSFKSGGYVVSIRQVQGADGRMRNLDIGDWVTRGSVLAVVRQQDYTDRREQANAQLARAQADHEHSKLSFDRTSNLYAAQSATKPELDQAKAQYDSSIAALNSAKASLAEAQTALDDSTLRAPFDGWIIKRSVDIGALVGPTSPGFTIADTRLVRAVFGVPDNSIGRIKLGQRQMITTDALPDEFPGRVTAISPAADPKSRVYSVEVIVQNPRDQLKSGMIASLALNGEILPGSVLAVPLSAVIKRPAESQRIRGFNDGRNRRPRSRQQPESRTRRCLRKHDSSPWRREGWGTRSNGGLNSGEGRRQSQDYAIGMTN